MSGDACLGDRYKSNNRIDASIVIEASEDDILLAFQGKALRGRPASNGLDYSTELNSSASRSFVFGASIASKIMMGK